MPEPQKPALVLVDDEPQILDSLTQLLDDTCEIHAFTSGHPALAFLRKNEVAIIISDHRMPDMLGTILLERAKLISPGTVRILLTGYSDMDAVINSVNSSSVFRYLRKPWNHEVLRSIVRTALINYQMAKKRGASASLLASSDNGGAQPASGIAAPTTRDAAGSTSLIQDIEEAALSKGLFAESTLPEPASEPTRLTAASVSDKEFLQVYVPFLRSQDESLENILVINPDIAELEQLGEGIGGKYRAVVVTAAARARELLLKGLEFDAILIDEKMIGTEESRFLSLINDAAPKIPKVLMISPERLTQVKPFLNQPAAPKFELASLSSEMSRPPHHSETLAEVARLRTIQKPLTLISIIDNLKLAMER